MKQILFSVLVALTSVSALAAQPCATGLHLTIEGHSVTIPKTADRARATLDGQNVRADVVEGALIDGVTYEPSIRVRLPETFRVGPYPSMDQAYVIYFDPTGTTVTRVQFEQDGDVDFENIASFTRVVAYEVASAGACL